MASARGHKNTLLPVFGSTGRLLRSVAPVPQDALPARMQQGVAAAEQQSPSPPGPRGRRASSCFPFGYERCRLENIAHEAPQRCAFAV